MELEDFKGMLENKIDRQTALPGKSVIKQIISNSGSGPFYSYRNNLRAALVIFPCVAAIFAATFVGSPAARQSVTLWMLFSILFTEFVFTIFNYQVVNKIRKNDADIRENLISKIALLKQSATWYTWINELLYVVLICLLEWVVYNQNDKNFESWGHVHFFIRLFVYGLFLVGQYFTKRRSQSYLYGRYLRHLRSLLDQLDTNLG